jgi:CRP-like cAMP-binding protein
MVMNESKLVACPLFKGMSKEEHDAFLERNINEMVKFAKGETVVRQGDTIRAMYLLIDGVVRTQMITREGNILEIDLLEAVIPLASAFMYASNHTYPVDVICMEPCTFLKISKSAWLEEMVNNEKLLMNFLTLN